VSRSWPTVGEVDNDFLPIGLGTGIIASIIAAR
jgi:hypothetical protein